MSFIISDNPIFDNWLTKEYIKYIQSLKDTNVPVISHKEYFDIPVEQSAPVETDTDGNGMGDGEACDLYYITENVCGLGIWWGLEINFSDGSVHHRQLKDSTELPIETAFSIVYYMLSFVPWSKRQFKIIPVEQSALVETNADGNGMGDGEASIVPPNNE